MALVGAHRRHRIANPGGRPTALAALAAALVVGAASPVGAAAPPGPSARPVTVPITTEQLDLGQVSESVVTVNISVGGGTSVPVRLDTGSAGLVILSSAVGPAVQKTSQSEAMPYLAGTVNGTVATGSVTIGGLATAKSTAFVEVPDSSRSAAGLFGGVDGILGIGMANGDEPAFPYSLLLQLPAPYWQGVTLHVATSGPGTMVLGPVRAPAGAISLPMQPLTPSRYPSGVPAYAKDPDMCWSASVGGDPPECATTDMDLGAPTPVFNPAALPNVPAIDGAILTPGTKLTAATSSGRTIVSFTAGASAPYVVHLIEQGYTQFNTGIELFFSHVVAYNVAAGAFQLWPSAGS